MEIHVLTASMVNHSVDFSMFKWSVKLWMNWAFFLKSWQSNLADRIGSSSNWSRENVSSYCSWTKGMVKQTVTTNERLKRLWIYESHILELRIKTWIWAIFVVMNTTWASTAPVSQRSWAQIPYTPEFFSGLIFTTAQAVFITAKIAFIFTMRGSQPFVHFS